jgi:transposase
MDRGLLEGYLAEGLSLTEIGALTNRDASTVGYWVKKYGLTANGRVKYAQRGGLDRRELERLVERGATLSEIARELDRSVSTVRHWLARYELKTSNARRRLGRLDGAKPKVVMSECHRHGRTDFVLEGRGAYRCRRCRSEAVSERRRRVKRTLVKEAGGECFLCGYDRHIGALEFHHLDPETKCFSLSHAGVTRSLAEARKEARKCALLCANCHAEVEAGVTALPVQLLADRRSGLAEAA